MNHPTYSLSGVQHPNRRIAQRRQDEQDWLDAIDKRQNARRYDDREHEDGTSFADRNPTLPERRVIPSCPDYDVTIDGEVRRARRSVAERNPGLDPVFADILQACGA